MRKMHRAQTSTRQQELDPQGFWGLWRMVISFQGAGNTDNYFRGSGEQAHSQFGDLVSTAIK